MAITSKDLREAATRLAQDKTWKGHLVLGIILLLIAAVVSSPLFIIVRELLVLILGLGGFVLIGWAIYQYVQSQEKKV